MTIEDMSRQLGAVRREVASGERDGEPTRVLTLAQTYDTGIDDVWDAVTSAERIPRWFLPVSGDLRLGGRYQLEGNAGGQVQRCEPPRLLGITWEYGGDVSWVEVRLRADGGDRTTLELEHTAHVSPERWAEYGPGATGVGWDSGLLGLANHLGSGLGVSPENAASWMGSDEGVAFFTGSSEAWGAAAVAAGEDQAVARAAADRTTAAYTGRPLPEGSAD